MKLKENILIAVTTILIFVVPIITGAAEPPGTVLITGANRGIGLALAKRFVESGYMVIGTARNPEKATDLKETGVRIERLDVTSQDSVDALARSLGDMPLDILINNAGIKGHDVKQLAGLKVYQLAQTLAYRFLYAFCLQVIPKP